MEELDQIVLYLNRMSVASLSGTLKREDIKVELTGQQQAPELIDFEEEELEEFSGEEEQGGSVFGHSVVSTETEKRGAAFKRKVENYLQQNRNSLNEKMQGRLQGVQAEGEEDHRDGKLMAELDNIRQNEKFTQQAELFILMFNKKPELAINDYVTKGFIHEDAPEAIAEYIIKLEGIDKAVLGQYFGKNEKRAMLVLGAFCRLLNFKGMEFDRAMRLLMSKFRLPGQAQQIERVIWQFALAFYEANNDIYANADELFPLAYAIIMLSTDAHNPKQEKKMTCEEFVKNTQRPCPSISQEYLTHIYNRITQQKFQTETDYFATIYGRLKDLAVSNIAEAIQISKELIKGDIFLKSCRSTNKFVQRRVYLSQDETKIQWVCDPPGSDTPRFIFIRDIKDLTLGIGSAVMQRNKVPADFDSLCFTITCTDRTLDLKARTTRERGKWINYLRAILIQRRQLRRQQLEERDRSTINSELIEQMWNNDIFPFWDKHWDYKLRKPKEKGYIARGLEAICSCWNESKKSNNLSEKSTSSGLNITTNLLEALWKHGLPPASRKTLWPLVIGNNLALTPMILEQAQKRKREVPELRGWGMDGQLVEMGEFLITMRPDLPPVRDLLLLTKVFSGVFLKEQRVQAVSGLLNFVHCFHFLSFYRGDKNEIQLRIQLFEHLMDLNVPTVRSHFKGLRLQTRMFLVGWFLTIFANCFEGEFLLRVWDNFMLQGQIYLFRAGIALIKYYEVELKMCTFNEGLKMLKVPQDTSPVLYFHILEKEIDVNETHYEEYIEKRKHAIIKTKVQSIPLD